MTATKRTKSFLDEIFDMKKKKLLPENERTIKTECDWCGGDVEVPESVVKEGIPVICAREDCRKVWDDEDA